LKGLEEKLDDKNNIKMEKIVECQHIFVTKVNNFSSFSQLLKELATDEYEIKIMNEQINIQPKSSIAYVNMMKGLKRKNRKFHKYKRKQKKSFKVILKHLHVTTNLDDIEDKKVIDDLRQLLIYRTSRNKIVKKLFICRIWRNP